MRHIYRVNWDLAVEDNNDWNMVLYPRLVVLDMLAYYINASLITPQELPYPETKTVSHVMQSIPVFWATLRNYQSETFNFTEKIPVGVQMFLIDSESWNFVYCSAPIEERYSNFDFLIFLDPFDKWSWILLLTSTIFVIPL